MKIAVYTCVTANYDPISAPGVVDPRLDYYCFADSEAAVPAPWRFVPVNLPHLNPQDQNRFVKMHPHAFEPLRAYDLTLYVDGSIRLVGDIYAMIANALEQGGEMFLYAHPERTCIYREAAFCAYVAHDWTWEIARQTRRYFRDGYPERNGLYEANVVIRHNSDRVADLMALWWKEYSSGVKRDQLSLPYVCWKSGFQISSLGKSDPRFSHHYFELVPHPKLRQTRGKPMAYINRLIAAVVPFERIFFGSSSRSGLNVT